jgi:hypothetical protein
VSRIRSIHPGLATDDEYMALSHVAARILPSLWCECDDQGVFEWKPLTLKARLLPVHNDDMAAILTELELHKFVKMIEVDGRNYGLVRNFRKFQRPKKPNATHVLPREFRNYVGLDDVSSEPNQASTNGSSPPVPHRFPTRGEKLPQMEDGGGRSNSDSKESGAKAPDDDPVKALFDAGVHVMTAAAVPEKQARSLVGKWRKELHDDGKLMAILTEAAEYHAVEPVAWITAAVASVLKPNHHGQAML